MKAQIIRLSPHQNGKVFAVLMTISAVLMFIPMAAMMFFIGPQVDANDNPGELPIVMLAALPVFYLVFGYIFVVIGCAIYNLVFKLIGGIEFELEEQDA